MGVGVIGGTVSTGGMDAALMRMSKLEFFKAITRTTIAIAPKTTKARGITPFRFCLIVYTME